MRGSFTERARRHAPRLLERLEELVGADGMLDYYGVRMTIEDALAFEAMLVTVEASYRRPLGSLS